MSVLRSRPVLRWLVPAAAAVTVIGGGAAIGTFAAQAEPSLPPRSAAQLLVDIQTSRLEGLSGTVVQRADLGLPPLAGLAAGGNDLLALATGTHTLRVWHSGPDRQRVALVDTLGERNIVRDGRDLWTYDSRTKSATHRTLSGSGEEQVPPSLPATPQEAADAALAAIDPSTEVSVGRSATVAGRDAYELVLKPRDEASLIDQIRVAVDAEEYVPLRFEVFADAADRPAFEVAFTQIDYRRPDADQFRFNPPPGTTVTEQSTGDKPGRDGSGPGRPSADEPGHPDAGDVTSVGEGWTTVVVAEIDTDEVPKPEAGDAEAGAVVDAPALIGGLPEVSGDWGKGRLFSTKLVNVLLTEDGRLLAGAVTPERLYQVAKG
ncbi:LolA family protein [Micromonospora sp. SH-82]|uniref:LolA family protein n=1 Tax=Micromonospora sp. SH-82 TaxID=3132938 RepID=UPI003EBC007D